MLKSVLPSYEQLLAQVQQELGPDRRPLLLAIDGPDGVGKSSLASWLSWQLEMPSAHLDLYLIPDTEPQQWRTGDLDCTIHARIDKGRPMIVEGVLLLDALDQIRRSPDFLIYICGEDESENEDEDVAALASDLHKSLLDYRRRQKPEERAQFKLAAAKWLLPT